MANALRRTIITDIEVIGFKTSPHKESNATIIDNTTRNTNEELMHRLCQIPVYYKSNNRQTTNIQDSLLLEVQVENITDTLQFVTTKDFKVKAISTNSYLSNEATKKMFPPFIAPTDGTEYYIEFAHLRPNVFGHHQGDRLHFTCKFSTHTAHENSVYSSVSTCSYSCSMDEVKARQKLETEMIPQWKGEDGKNSLEEIEFETKNWMLLYGRREILPDSFDFVVETIGVYTNRELVQSACTILVERLERLASDIIPTILIERESVSTMDNCFLISLGDGFGDNTISPMLEYLLIHLYFEGASGRVYYSYCASSIDHPQSLTAKFRIAFSPEVFVTKVEDPDTFYTAMLRDHFLHAIQIGISNFVEIKKQIK